MPFERIVEEIIRQAVERGEFKNLPGKGKKLDLDLYFQAPAETRMAQKLLMDQGWLPREVELLKEIQDLKARAATTKDPVEERQLRRQLERRRLELDIRTEALSRRAHRP